MVVFPLSAAAAASALDKGMISIPAPPFKKVRRVRRVHFVVKCNTNRIPDRLVFPSPLLDPEEPVLAEVAGVVLDDIGVMDTLGLTGLI